ncbi:hypothetical protein [Methanosphaerula palustris]|uniref:MASE1 domain-containing protein n=1 Tax=Methanosphaerula palustris (strain ATCC BAA-1556 / DSM 19958 / E1-9c) TaxID=521011 RepID=B8GGZ3_METPE|nr:hypothetical protein [Methanosphaerula palustris]ACL16398.1 conserved hypothetical protein [Methanosphaerula palustris E1-9c]
MPQKSLLPIPVLVAFVLLLTLVDALIAKFMVFISPASTGVSSLYLSVAFMIVFTLWFGMGGAFAAYWGCFIGAGLLGGVPAGVNLYWSIGDLLQVLIPLIAFQLLHADISLQTWRDARIFLVFGVLVNNITGALWGVGTLYLSGLITGAAAPATAISWFTGNALITLLIAPLLLHLLTPSIRTSELYVGGTWFGRPL